MSLSWRKHLRSCLSQVGVYDVPPSRSPARLHANEASFDWPPSVIRDLAAAVLSVELNRYPDTSARELRVLVAERLGCDSERVVLGNGSVEILALLLGLFNGCERPVLVVPVPAFAVFGMSGRAYGYEVRQVPLRRNFQLDVPALRRALRDATLCIVTRPNNPTGSLCSRQDVEALIAEFPETVFVVDEAYAAFAPGCSMFRRDAPDNQVHLDTLSKRGLAALRLGYCVAHPELAHALDKVRMPYNLSQTSLVMAQRVLTKHSAVLDGMLNELIARRESLRTILARIPAGAVHVSHANMVLVSFCDRASARYWHHVLMAQGVHVRDVSNEPGFAELGLLGCLRVSTGSAREHELLAHAIDSIQSVSADGRRLRAAAGARR
jgi:histidinol-phosphate aminotransferase